MTKKRKTKSDKPFRKQQLAGMISKLFAEQPKASFNYKQLARMLGVTRAKEKQKLLALLYDLETRGQVEQVARGKFRGVNTFGKVVGKIQRTASGAAFLIPEEDGTDVFIAERNLKQALNGDTVAVHVFAHRRGRSPEGEVVEIIKRSRELFVGTLELSENFAFLVCDHRQLGRDIFIPLNKLKGCKDGQKAVARITDWPERVKNPYGEIVSVLGDAGDNHAEMHAILAEFELPYEYPQAVIDFAENISEKITADEIKNRRDFREVTTFTIDPFDAKDFDDALSIRSIGENRWEIGVHIADVTHYVQTENILEEEARLRATSVYLVDRVVPMLPERLSNFICSLRPHEEKLCYSVVFHMNDTGEVLEHWIGRTIINSDHRFTYEEAQEIIEGGESPLKEEILTLNNLAQQIRDKRFSRGAIAFNRKELRFKIDDTGKPISTYYKEAKESNQLVEEFMLLANKTVAELIGKQAKNKQKTFVYRVHEKPNPDKIEAFNTFIARFGYHLDEHDGAVSSTDVNKLLHNIQGKNEQNLIETLAIRSMAKATYTCNNVGHYGLAFPYYTHFTSPIRRYPDMMVHRLLHHYAHNGKNTPLEVYEEHCKHSSEMEQRAANAERASIKYKQVEFLEDKIGQTFDGIISGVSQWGLYVEIQENGCEGMVPIREMEDDFYEFDDAEFALIGKRTGKIYRLSDPVKIEVIRTNIEKRQIDFALS